MNSTQNVTFIEPRPIEELNLINNDPVGVSAVGDCQNLYYVLYHSAPKARNGTFPSSTFNWDYANCCNLSYVTCSGTSITSVNLAFGMPYPTNVYVSYLYGYYLSQLTSLQSLYAQGNMISAIPSELCQMGSLYTVNFDSNCISSVPYCSSSSFYHYFSANTAITLRNNPIANIPSGSEFYSYTVYSYYYNSECFVTPLPSPTPTPKTTRISTPTPNVSPNPSPSLDQNNDFSAESQISPNQTIYTVIAVVVSLLFVTAITVVLIYWKKRMKMNASVVEKNIPKDSPKDIIRELPQINSTSLTKVKYNGKVYKIELIGKFEVALSEIAKTTGAVAPIVLQYEEKGELIEITDEADWKIYQRHRPDLIVNSK